MDQHSSLLHSVYDFLQDLPPELFTALIELEKEGKLEGVIADAARRAKLNRSAVRAATEALCAELAPLFDSIVGSVAYAGTAYRARYTRGTTTDVIRRHHSSRRAVPV